MYVAVVILGNLYKTWQQKENNRNRNIIHISINDVNVGGGDGVDEDLQNVFCTINGAPSVIGFLLDVIIQLMDESSLNIRLSIEFDTCIIEIVQLVFLAAIQSSINAVGCNEPVIHRVYVCAVFYYLFFVYFFEFVSACCIIDNI